MSVLPNPPSGPPWLTVALAVATVLLATVSAWALLRARRAAGTQSRPPAAVVFTGFAAACCTAYSADTSWRFAEHELGMVGFTERAALFAAGEIALMATALMARHNNNHHGSPGTPGALVWLITGVQVIPAYSESGAIAGTVRAFFGPILAALLWHLAMGIELRHVRPGALSRGLAATVGRELRERALSWLGLAVRDRTAEQITRDRAVARAARLASRPKLHAWGRMRLAAAVARSGAGTDDTQTRRLLDATAARRHATALTTVALPSPWKPAVPAPGPASVPVLLPVPVPAVNGVRRAAKPVPVPAAPRTSPPAAPVPASNDVLVKQARAKYGTTVPSIRTLRDDFGIGQPRATKIQDELKAGPTP